MTPNERRQKKRDEIDRIMKEIHDLEDEFFRKRKLLEDRATELERQILKGEY